MQIVRKVSTSDDDQMDSLKNAASHDKPELHEAEDDGTHERGGRLGDESEMRECDTMEHIEIGSDEHEDLCHKCEKYGALLCCDGCPIAMHADCLEILGLKIPGPEDDWFCPICADKMAAELLTDAKQVCSFAYEGGLFVLDTWRQTLCSTLLRAHFVLQDSLE